jgi:hypothetical protein
VGVRDEQREPGRRQEVGNAVIGSLAAALERGAKSRKNRGRERIRARCTRSGAARGVSVFWRTNGKLGRESVGSSLQSYR